MFAITREPLIVALMGGIGVESFSLLPRNAEAQAIAACEFIGGVQLIAGRA